MKLNSLKLAGFIGIKKGLGLDEINLDLSGLSGLIALSGQNGTGKTTILENLQPYRTLASRSKALQHHVFTRDACRELEFDFQGDNYKTKILIDCDSGKQEGYVWKNGVSEIDGKARNYDAYISALFGSKELFFNSIFCAQNSSKLSDLTTGKLKELFSEFLRLDQYIAYENTTKQCVSLLGTQGNAYQREAEKLREILDAMSGLHESLDEKRAELSLETDKSNEIRGTIKKIEADITKTKEAISANQVQNTRAEDFRARIKSLKHAIEIEERSYKEKVSSLKIEISGTRDEIHNLSQLLEQRDSIEQAVILRKRLADVIEVETENISSELNNISEIKDRIREIEAKVNTEIIPSPNEARIPILKEKICSLKTQTEDLERRDPECTSTICGFIKTALEAEKSLPALEKQLSEAIEDVRKHTAKNVKSAEVLYKRKNGLKEEEKRTSEGITALKLFLAGHKKEYDNCYKLASQAGDLREAIAKKNAAEKHEKTLTAQGLKLKGEYAQRIQESREELALLKTALEDVLSQIDLSAHEALASLERNIDLKRTFEGNIAKKISELTKEVNRIESALAQNAVYEKQVAEAEKEANAIQIQISEWSYLKSALSKDGIRALEIDAVAPSISAYANEILFNTFGPAYSVKLRTQDDEGREVLDILALGEDGKETLLDDLSGGEKVWSLKALRLAMTLISKQKSGRQFLSALADEEDGALDAENAQNFVDLYRSFMETGGFEDCYFISHRPECVAMADHVLEFGKGGINIK